MVASTITSGNGPFSMGSPERMSIAWLEPARTSAPVSPLTQSVLAAAVEGGYRDAARALRIAADGVSVRFRDNMLQATLPSIALDGEAGSLVDRELPVMAQRWEREYLPRLRANLDRLATMRLATVNPRALPFLIDEVAAIARDTWAIRFLVGITASIAIERFAELVAEVDGGASDVAVMLAGLPGEVEKGRIERSDLAKAARAAGLDGLIQAEAPQRVVDRLRATEMGRYFLAALNDHLREYGLRQERLDLAVATWLEDPTPALAEIRGYLSGECDPRAELQTALMAGVRALNRARESLAEEPQTTRDRFESLASCARSAHLIQQELTFYVDQQSVALTRLLFLRLGARLADNGAIGRPEDVFMLGLDELKQVSLTAPTAERLEAR